MSSLKLSPISSAWTCASAARVAHEVGQQPLDDPVLAHDLLGPLAAGRRSGSPPCARPARRAPRPRAASASRRPRRARRRASRPRARRASAIPASAAGTRRSGRRGSRSSPGTRRPNVPAPCVRNSTRAARCKGALTETATVADGCRPDRSCSSAPIAGADHLHRPADGPAARRRPGLQGVPQRDRDRDPALPALGRAHRGDRAGRRRAQRDATGASSAATRRSPSAASRSACSASSTTTRWMKARRRKALPRPGRRLGDRVRALALRRPDAGALARALHRHRDRPAQLLRGPRDRPGGGARTRSASPTCS